MNFNEGDFVYVENGNSISIAKIAKITNERGKYKIYYTWIRCDNFPDMVGVYGCTDKIYEFNLLTDEMKTGLL